jgi:hypothetical protein
MVGGKTTFDSVAAAAIIGNRLHHRTGSIFYPPDKDTETKD